MTTYTARPTTLMKGSNEYYPSTDHIDIIKHEGYAPIGRAYHAENEGQVHIEKVHEGRYCFFEKFPVPADGFTPETIAAWANENL